MRRTLLITAAVSSLSASAQQSTRVTLRQGTVLQAESVELTEQHLSMQVGGDMQILGWFEVAAVDGSAAEDAARYLDDAELAWRGLVRLERDDHVAAEPALETAFEHFAGSAGRTSAVLAEALLDCRLRRGAQALAVEPLLVLLWNGAAADESELLDDRLRLCPLLPPFWASRGGLAPMLDAVGEGAERPWAADTRAAQLSQLYAASAEHELSGSGAIPDFVPVDDGVDFVRQVVEAFIGDASTRERARNKLGELLENGPPVWQRAWIHAALGRSLLRDSDARSVRLGVVQLLHVPALYREAQPHLAGTCLAAAAIALNDAGRPGDAASMVTLLRREYRDHDALNAPLIRQIMMEHDSGREADRRGLEGE